MSLSMALLLAVISGGLGCGIGLLIGANNAKKVKATLDSVQEEYAKAVSELNELKSKKTRKVKKDA